MYLEERRQLEKALYFIKLLEYQNKLATVPVLLTGQGKENGYCGDFVVSPLNARLNALF